MTIQFDTLRYVEQLKLAGVSDIQAKAKAEALSSALCEFKSSTLAAKGDMAGVKLEFAEIRADIKPLKWMIVTVIAGLAVLVMKAFRN